MDEKLPLLPAHNDQPVGNDNDDLTAAQSRVQVARTDLVAAQKEYHAVWKRTTQGRIVTFMHTFLLTVLLLIVAIPTIAALAAMLSNLDDIIDPSPIYNGGNRHHGSSSGKVQLEAHIMSKCPDARDCLRDLVLPAMIEVSPMVNFTLSYIGRPTPDSKDGVECMHGPTECLGNILELCAANLYPDPKLYLGFTMCLSKGYEDVPDRQLVQDCALEHGLSFEKLNECASDDSGSGMDLLRNSVKRSESANVTTSCTVRVNNKVWCVRDGGKWKDCPSGSDAKALVKEIKSLAEEEDEDWVLMK